MFLDNLEPGIVLHARDEEHLGGGPFGEQAIAVVASIIHHDRARGKVHLVGRADIMDLPLGNEAETG